MNIFYLSHNTKKCAQEHVDKHVVKMILEYAQLLSTAHRVLDPTPQNGELLYASTHANHPSAKWARSSKVAYEWLYSLFCELSNEYTYRYRKQHLTYSKLKDALKLLPHNIEDTIWTPPTPAMPDECKVANDSLLSYRNYYNSGKQHLAVWSKRDKPTWYITKE